MCTCSVPERRIPVPVPVPGLAWECGSLVMTSLELFDWHLLLPLPHHLFSQVGVLPRCD